LKTKFHLVMALALLFTLAAQRASASQAITDLAIFKVASANPVQVGQQMQFFLTLSNGGPDVVTSAVTVTDLLPAGFQYVTNAGIGSYTSTSGLWMVIPGTSGTTNLLTITVLATNVGIYTNTATITALPEPIKDPNPSNNTASVIVVVTAQSTPVIVGGATYADSGSFTLDTTGVSPIIGDASYADSANFTLNVTSFPPTPALLLAPVFTPGQYQNLQFTVTGQAESQYVVQGTTSLSPAIWVNLVTNAAPFVFVDTTAGIATQHFYRVLFLP
jgi:uncharacterized repeat protein (TIGR01451 family)